ncbi:tripartite tricarboxylate transporter substrate-binding protein [Comamonas composti]|uniref:tripartite tricarboxylate transporter substrate-binding protein n=1 Tax=Comamonas composti TaxID=408558 RepID=UPI00040C204D|nr:tripartite tricarboxylate transporter substrate-binding protein [Comamonas composti]
MLPGLSSAQPRYPSQPISLVAPFARGGVLDGFSQMLAGQLSLELGQPVLVSYRDGACGTLGAKYVAKAAADGYTLLLGAVHHAVAQSLNAQLGYDIREMTPVGYVGRVSHVLIVSNSFEAGSVIELIALLKTQPDRYSYASLGVSSMQHMMAEQFRCTTGTRVKHVVYEGSSQALEDLAAGRTHLMFEPVPSALPYIRQGRVRAIAVTSASRTRALPEVPTVAEAGSAGYGAACWLGLFAPDKLSQSVVLRLNQALNRAFSNPGFTEGWLMLGAEPGGGSPKALARMVASEVARWAMVADQAGISI